MRLSRRAATRTLGIIDRTLLAELDDVDASAQGGVQERLAEVGCDEVEPGLSEPITTL